MRSKLEHDIVSYLGMQANQVKVISTVDIIEGSNVATNALHRELGPGSVSGRSWYQVRTHHPGV